MIKDAFSALLQKADATSTANAAHHKIQDSICDQIFVMHRGTTPDLSKILQHPLFDDLQFMSHLFGGGLSGHVQSTVAHGGGSRGEGGGRADEEGGNSELHVDCLLA